MNLQEYFIVALILSNIASFLVGGLLVYSVYEIRPTTSHITNLQKEVIGEDVLELGGEVDFLALYGENAAYASKNGTRYYPASCTAGINRIKAENLVWYPSPELAKLEGLSIAAACRE